MTARFRTVFYKDRIVVSVAEGRRGVTRRGHHFYIGLIWIGCGRSPRTLGKFFSDL